VFVPLLPLSASVIARLGRELRSARGHRLG
jgi:hypothetical protein